MSARTDANTEAELEAAVGVDRPVKDVKASGVPAEQRGGRITGLGSRRLLVPLLQVTVALGILAIWQFGTGNPATENVLIDEFFVSKPTEIWAALERWYDQGVLFTHVWVTLQEALIGFAIGAVSGGTVGLTLGVSPFLAAVFRPFVTAAYSVPRLALAPLLILWFGLGMESKIALVALMVFFLTFFNAFEGAREVDRDFVNVLRVIGASRFQKHAKVTIPSAGVWILTGLRISIPYAFVGAIVGEIIAANEGLGHLIARASGQFDAASLFAAIFLAVVLSLTLTGAVTLFERRVLRWRPEAG